MTKQTSKRQMMRDRRAKEATRNRLFTIGMIVVGSVLVLGMILGPTIADWINPWEPKVPPQRALSNVNDNAIGAADAPITITEFSDFQCPYCRRFWENTEDQLIQAYVETGTVRFVYRSFGLFIGAESAAAAEAAYCAGDQGKFWEMHDFVFFNQTGENIGDFTNSHLTAMAELIGLDMNAYNSCISGNKYANRVTQDGIDGAAAGLQATPSFVISYVVNGETRTKTIQGAESFSTFQAEIEAALAEIAAGQ